MDREPDILDCSALERAGLWHTGKCCAQCHAGDHDEDLDMDIGPPGSAGWARIFLCCNVTLRGPVLTGEQLAALLGRRDAPSGAEAH